MSAPFELSRRAFKDAKCLGKRIFSCDQRIYPQLARAAHYGRFEDFRLMHRMQLENLRAYCYWERELGAIAECEGRRHGISLDRGSECWDVFYSVIVQPLKEAMWSRWEECCQLEEQYHHQRQKFGAAPVEEEAGAGAGAGEETVMTGPVIAAALMLIKKEVGQGDVSTEQEWDAIAGKLFEQMNGDADQKLWEIPPDGLAPRQSEAAAAVPAPVASAATEEDPCNDDLEDVIDPIDETPEDFEAPDPCLERLCA